MTTETKSFQAEIQQLLNILVHSLYTDREIFLRELISNASDSLHRLKFEMLTNREVLDPDAELAIRIVGDAEAGTLSISDSGVGMTHDELITNLGTIAHSGASAFIQSLEDGQRAVDQIGQFGVGFYSVFMVADEVRVTSRSYQPEAEAWTWIASGGNDFTMEPAERVARGTTIVIKLKEDAKEFAENYRLQTIIHNHSEFVSFPIYLGEEAEPINRQEAIWRQSIAEVTDEAANGFYKQITLDFSDPLTRIHVNTDAPVQIYALLFIPSQIGRGMFNQRQDYGLRLYSRRVRIQDHAKDLLPEYLRFVEGVVDSEDLPLNISREAVQSSPVMRRIERVISGRVFSSLKDLAAKEPDIYTEFWNGFGPFLKEGVTSDQDQHEKLLPLLRFHSSTGSDALVSLKDYIDRVKPDQKAIYYIVGEDVDTLARSPHLDYFRSEEIEVLYFTDPLDGFLPTSIGDYEDFPMKNVADAGLDLPKGDEEETLDEQDTEPEESLGPLIERFKAQLGERVVDVRISHLLVEHPSRLVTPEGAMGSEMDRVRRLMDQDYEAPKKILELNSKHPIINNLADLVSSDDEDGLVNASIDQIFENSLLLEGLHPNPADMVDRIQTILEAATDKR